MACGRLTGKGWESRFEAGLTWGPHPPDQDEVGMKATLDPDKDTGEDGFIGISPVMQYAPNAYRNRGREALRPMYEKN